MPVVACYCQDFLKVDMQHIHRQIVSLQRWEPRILTQRRENAALFPVVKEKHIDVLPPVRGKNLRRFYYKHIKRRPLVISPSRVVELMMAAGRTEAEVVHVFFGHIAVMLLPWLKVCPLPVVVSFHGADAGVASDDPQWQLALQEVFSAATLILARSEALLGDLERLGCPPSKLRLQRTGIPLEAWPFEQRHAPADGAWHFLQACRLVEKKGLLTSLAAFAAIAAQLPSARFTIAGDGPLRPEIIAAIASRGLADRVTLHPFLPQSELRPLVESAHLLFHPSETAADGNREGVPNAMLEAMASGLPILATRHGGIPEAVTSGFSGVLVSERDHGALAAAALAYCADPPAYAAASAAAAAEVASKYERARQTAILETYYDEAQRMRLRTC